MESELASVGLGKDDRVSFFPAVQIDEPGPFMRAGSHGCFISHRRILEDAAREMKSVLILQDDCKFLDEIFSYKKGNCDIFYGGYVAKDPHDLHNSDIIGAHFMGFTAHAANCAAEYLSRFLRDPTFELDEKASQEGNAQRDTRPPIDGALVWFRRAHPELKTEFALLSEQRRSRTDIGDQKWFDRVPVVRQVIELLRGHKNSRSSEFEFANSQSGRP